MTDQILPAAMDTNYCHSCGQKFRKTASACPLCDALQAAPPSTYAANPQNWSQLFFSANGRIGRQQWWICRLIIQSLLFVLMFWPDLVQQPTIYSSEDVAGTVFLAGFVVGLIACVWSALCLNTKRWHDRDYSGWMQLVALIPLIDLWSIIENGFLCGTKGPNRFGPDPLTKR